MKKWLVFMLITGGMVSGVLLFSTSVERVGSAGRFLEGLRQGNNDVTRTGIGEVQGVDVGQIEEGRHVPVAAASVAAENQGQNQSQDQNADQAEDQNVNGNANANYTDASVDFVVRDMYFVYDGTTIVLPSEIVKGFIRSDCQAPEDSCLDSVPCVDVVSVNIYVRSTLLDMLEGQEVLKEARNENGSFLYRGVDWSVDEGQLTDEIVSSLTTLSLDYQEQTCGKIGEPDDLLGESLPNPVIWVLKKEIAGTDGLYASRYIEIDDSQQHLYLWQDGKVVKDYEISGFYDQYAVYGVFSIINKSPNAWSNIAKKWMPWWMAYHYDSRQNAMLGIHELVYWTDENGVYHEESSDSIGQKKSGGCIRLDRGKAEEFYQMITVGTPVLIHE